ncbi:MAG: hypothetical protein LBB23_04970 [Rickettsiales bacterium]|jgi:hypothetical protein|nr:hypothetical protein [Rickettsiales bacterium]
MMKILFIEDTPSDIDAFNTALGLYNSQNNNAIEAKNIASVAQFDDVFKSLSDYDAVIVDIKLKDAAGSVDADIDAGNNIIKKIERALQNVPIYIYTGTPENISYAGQFVVRKYTKGDETTYKQVIEYAHRLYNTGLMQIIGGKGKLYEFVQRVYKENIIKDIDKWIDHKIAGKDTEGILSRYIAACISAHLENFSEAVKEEMFMIPPVGTGVKTGSIVKNNNTSEYFVVLTPECDLVVRDNGNPKTDFVLLCKLQNNTNCVDRNNLCNYKVPYAYCLPKSSLIDAITFLNFREVASIKYNDFVSSYARVAQILPAFTKEITQKFSQYYSRQGQPDFSVGEIQ